MTLLISHKDCDVSLLPGFSGHSLLRDPRHNKGLSFTEKERDAHYMDPYIVRIKYKLYLYVVFCCLFYIIYVLC